MRALNGARTFRKLHKEGRVLPLDPLAFKRQTHTPESRARISERTIRGTELATWHCLGVPQRREASKVQENRVLRLPRGRMAARSGDPGDPGNSESNPSAICPQW